MLSDRNLTALILNERQTYQKMIFISGPRQVGKTTVLQELAKQMPGPILNWDNLEHRSLLSKEAESIFLENENVFFDEIHKYPRWKNFLKGAFDVHGERCRIHVTGSARLDVYRRGGDSLLGRYILFRLHPFSVGEVLNPKRIPKEHSLEELLAPEPASLKEAESAWETLKKFGGFPEPFFKQSTAHLRRWRRLRNERLVREDIRDITRIRELALLEQMIALFPDRVGQPYSMNALREILEVSHDSIRLWTQCLDEFYYAFFIPPYSKNIARTLKKERKMYLWDYSEVNDTGPRFENMVAAHLLKWSHVANDLGEPEIKLHYVKNKEKQEVDFLVTKEKKPFLLIEAKSSEQSPTLASLKHSRTLGNVPILQLIDAPGVLKTRKIDGISWTLMSASRFFSILP